jgi:hypothetical protein
MQYRINMNGKEYQINSNRPLNQEQQRAHVMSYLQQPRKIQVSSQVRVKAKGLPKNFTVPGTRTAAGRT